MCYRGCASSDRASFSYRSRTKRRSSGWLSGRSFDRHLSRCCQVLQTFSQGVNAHAAGFHRGGSGHVQCGARMALQEDREGLGCRRERDTARSCATIAVDQAPLQRCWQPSKILPFHQCVIPVSAGARAFRDLCLPFSGSIARAASVTTSIAASTALFAALPKSPSVRPPFRAPFLVASVRPTSAPSRNPSPRPPPATSWWTSSSRPSSRTRSRGHARLQPLARLHLLHGSLTASFAEEAYFLPSFSSTFLRLLPADFTADLTSALLAPVLPASYFTSWSCPPATSCSVLIASARCFSSHCFLQRQPFQSPTTPLCPSGSIVEGTDVEPNPEQGIEIGPCI